MKNKLFLHFSVYSFGGLLISIAGFISFPILTRFFSVEEYGLMNLVSTTLAIIVGLSKLGVHNSIVRYVHEIRNNNSKFNNDELFNTVFFSMLFFSLLIAILWSVSSQYLPLDIVKDEQIYGLFLLTSLLIPIRVIFSFFSNTLKSLEKSIVLTTYKVIQRYLTLALMLLFIFYISENLYGFYWAIIIAELSVLIAMARNIFNEFSVNMSRIRYDLLKPMIVYGAPLMMYELSAALLNTGDRYIIQAISGSAQMGLYSAAYNLCDYVYTIFVVSVGSAIMPMYMRIWEEKGEAETKKFLKDTLYYYTLVAVPIIFGIMILGDELLDLMASSKYTDGAVVMPYVISGMLVKGAVLIFAAGLYIQKNTIMVMWLVLASASLNVVLNLLLIPTMGIEGAAIATLISYITLALLGYYYGRKALLIIIPYEIFAKALFASLIMMYLISLIDQYSVLINLILGAIAGVLTYGLIMIFIDKKSKLIVFNLLKRFR